jgi:hypothetical protein
MLKSWVFGSVAAGIGLFATALYIATQPLAFTESQSVGELSEPVLSRAMPANAAPLVVEDSTPVEVWNGDAIELPPLVVEPVRAVTAPEPQAERPLEPCSNWRELGPAHVVEGVALDTRRVRELC